MSDVVLRMVSLSKVYRIGEERGVRRTMIEAIKEAAKRPIERIRHPGAATHASTDLWALRGLDLEVMRGDVLGIIGRNGAGKSTLLKVLSHITEPSEGKVQIKGRVASLLEVGTGFHAELTGRENIYLNGAILGMTRSEIKSRFDEIVEFSEIGRFLDTPVKRYSSGMYVRLAFAVAAHLDPDVLLVDEVLAVGDLAFQQKCLASMRDVGAQGRTVLFVSHNMAAIRALCTRAILLDAGSVVARGTPEDMVARYSRAAGGPTSIREWSRRAGPGDEHFRLLRLEIRQHGTLVEGEVDSSSPLEVSMRFYVGRPSRKLQVGFELLTDDRLSLFQSFHTDLGSRNSYQSGDYEVRCELPPMLLNAGTYVISPLAALYFTQWIVRRDPDTEIRVAVNLAHARSDMWYSAREGALAPSLEWKIDSIDGASEWSHS